MSPTKMVDLIMSLHEIGNVITGMRKGNEESARHAIEMLDDVVLALVEDMPIEAQNDGMDSYEPARYDMWD